MRLWLLTSLFVLGFLSLNQPAQAFSTQIIREPTHVRVVLPYSLDLVWKWTLKALKGYTITEANLASKSIQTAWLEDPYNLSLFKVPEYFPYHEQVRTQLHIRFVKTQDQLSTIVHIQKTFQFFQNLFDGWRDIDPDGIEEYVLGYRIRQLAYYYYILSFKQKEAATLEE